MVATFDGPAGAPRVLLIGHLDTVFDPGTAAARPFRIEDGIAYGPGVTDMKSGLLAGLYALKALIGERGGLPFERLVFVANPDEEIGSPTSTPHIRELAPGWTPRSSSNALARTATSSRRARGSSTCGSSSTGARRTPAWSPRRVAARSSKPPGSSATCTPSTAAGPA